MSGPVDADVRDPYPRATDSLKRWGNGLCMIAFPIMLLFGFLAHPNIMSLDPIKEVQGWILEWRGNLLFHIGHLAVMFAVPPIIAATVRLMALPHGRGAWFATLGGVLGVYGAFMLAVDKGALTLVLTAFQTVPVDRFDGIVPALQTLLDRAGWLWITWTFLALPLGVALQMVGLISARIIPKWQGISTIIGLLLLINPDIEIISAIGATLIGIGFIPMGIREIRGTLSPR